MLCQLRPLARGRHGEGTGHSNLDSAALGPLPVHEGDRPALSGPVRPDCLKPAGQSSLPYPQPHRVTHRYVATYIDSPSFLKKGILICWVQLSPIPNWLFTTFPLP